MAITCPPMNLRCDTTSAEVDQFENTARIYFNASQTLDYFNFFLDRGTHSPAAAEQVNDPEHGNCDWEVNGRRYEWPLVRTDSCVLGYDVIEDRAAAENLGTSLDGLKGAIRNYHKHGGTSTEAEAIPYALSILSGGGTAATAGPFISGCAFPVGSNDGTVINIKFGAYYSN
jgi:hypothetical protein